MNDDNSVYFSYDFQMVIFHLLCEYMKSDEFISSLKSFGDEYCESFQNLYDPTPECKNIHEVM